MSQFTSESIKVSSERAVLVGVHLPDSYVDPDDPFRELRALAETAGAVVVGEMIQRRRRPRARTYLGKGKVEELATLVASLGATLVIFDNDLSPAQVRGLEEAARCKIIDRSELILDIFANRAATHAAKLQVEIAQLEYTYPRLRAMWDHLGQIVGGAPVGIGTRGPGEKQLEIDRRIVQQRLRQLKNELEGVQSRKTREVHDRQIDHFTVGLVGYTNAGKSTLFNRLTSGGAFAHSKLFATLSTRIERWRLGGGNDVLLSDTVGFIRDLPHHLVASFRSTLEETVAAHLLLIVLDASDPSARMQLETVERTLDEIGASDQPRILVLNKVDRLSKAADVLVWLNDYPDAIAISAKSGEGLADLEEAVKGHLLGGERVVTVATPISDGKTTTFLEQRADVIERRYDNGEAVYDVRLGRRHVEQLLARGARLTINGLEAREALAALWEGSARTDDRGLGVPPHRRVERVQSETQHPKRPNGADLGSVAVDGQS